MFAFKLSFLGGTHIQPHKNTQSQEIIVAKAPQKVYLQLAQHRGAPAKKLVKLNDQVCRGQLIAEKQGLVSANIHSSVSGKVVAIEQQFMVNGMLSETIVIENDYLDTPYPHEDYFKILSAEEIYRQIELAGIVGMGGGGFPTHVKYTLNKTKPTEMIILNGIECEPYITSDHRAMLEYADELILGLKYMMKLANCTKGIIAVEDNKPDVIKLLQHKLKDQKQITVAVCKEKYPQGSEKHLIYAVCGRTVPANGLPADVGVVINNVATAIAVARAIDLGEPLTERVVTISGDNIVKPGNYLVRIGTLFSELICENAGGLIKCNQRVICGGPMMGFAIPSLDFPVTKTSGGILCFADTETLAAPESEAACVRCGKCVDVCPMGLMPTEIVRAGKHNNWQRAKEENILMCVECGACAYNCPARIPLVQYIRMGKEYTLLEGRGKPNPII